MEVHRGLVVIRKVREREAYTRLTARVKVGSQRLQLRVREVVPAPQFEGGRAIGKVLQAYEAEIRGVPAGVYELIVTDSGPRPAPTQTVLVRHIVVP